MSIDIIVEKIEMYCNHLYLYNIIVVVVLVLNYVKLRFGIYLLHFSKIKFFVKIKTVQEII